MAIQLNLNDDQDCISSLLKKSLMILKTNSRNESEEHVFKVLIQINSYESTGLDETQARFLKEVVSFLNSSDNCITDEMKNTRVIPLYKKKRKLDFGNY